MNVTKKYQFMMPYILIFLLLYLLSMGLILLDGFMSTAKKASYAVVLGNQVLPSGELSPRLQARLDKAVELYQTGIVPKIIVSGGIGKEGHDEAVVMKHYLEIRGVPQSAVVADSKGYNTRLTAQNARQWIEVNAPVIIVSQLYHISRSKMAFRQAGFQDVGAAYPLYFEWRDLFSTVREVPAWIKYWFGAGGWLPISAV
jgi:vancomycin permeability regulator SanA